MKEYRVIWEIDITANSPREAAEKAESYMGTYNARVYAVRVLDPTGQLIVEVDLDTHERHG